MGLTNSIGQFRNHCDRINAIFGARDWYFEYGVGFSSPSKSEAATAEVATEINFRPLNRNIARIAPMVNIFSVPPGASRKYARDRKQSCLNGRWNDAVWSSAVTPGRISFKRVSKTFISSSEVWISCKMKFKTSSSLLFPSVSWFWLRFLL